MAKLSILAGATNQSISVYLVTASTQAPILSLVFNTANFTCYYCFKNAASVQVTLATLAAVNSVWSSGGFLVADNTHMQGVYRFDPPNAALASGNGRMVTFVFNTGASANCGVFEIELTGTDNQDGVRMGLTALPSAAVGSGANSFNFDSAGYIQSDPMKINNVSTSSVSAIGAFIGNATAALAVDASGRVDVSKIKGIASAGQAGYMGLDWFQMVNADATIDMTATTIAGIDNTINANVVGVQAGAITDAAFTVPSVNSTPATGIIGMIYQIFQKLFGKVVKDSVAKTITTTARGQSTPMTTQTYTTTAIIDTTDQVNSS